ncbi:pyridoxal phosphate-dependent aminotransferase [Anaerovoracaceae bacterium 41-7]|jgi:aspartate aminotransferase|uniref:Aminotransferase n=1 Tax=Anaerotruncus colihominis TaxID=169435 RepID=A0A845QK74_9FIRM|nr:MULTISPECIES: pyridoxal phosphate-dependent aminotransferase [Clostridia]MCI9475503.1 pyridoxal phosphate-dependent aminotransferase [Emergencia sp.]MCI9641100.1 pyridoxal phosphate-dependent aminotransferase [Emergencia sp.]NBH61153.1 pyridoxal phosphate-dependent aminotransferase [Anaerotruncus colihominis]NCE98963.1 pyridoxal phosphate-dependent aminotransferase [Emergencia sp. 1XD21-10]NCF01808.1 pyridoxal phosphate-dependent aminotransferase [Anaerotruncus sp. 80]
MKLSNKVEAMQFSPIRKFNPIAQKAKDAGKKVYHLNIGQPDVETPACFMDAIRAYENKVIAYAESGGITELQDAVSDYFKTYGMEIGRNDMIVTTGGSEALTMTFLALLNEGDEVLIAEPFYTNYHTFATSAGGKVVPITTKAEEGYHYAKREQIEPLITEKTKAICCINPGNPTGTVLTKEEMQLIGDIAKEHDLWIIADEVYREFAYDGREAVSFGQVKDVEDRVIIIDSVSKRFSACGARIGLLVSKNQEFMQSVMKIAQGRLCVSTVDQVGAAALFKLPASYYDEVKAEYCGRRDVVYEELMKIPGVVCRKPGGAFYMTAKLPVDSVEDFLMFLLTEFEDNGETVMFAPAEGFYATPGLGKDEMRIAYVLNQADMRRGVELIRLGIEAYNKR